jgi:hypothetical protein
MSARRSRKQVGFAVGAITGRWSSEEGPRSIPSAGLGVTERSSFASCEQFDLHGLREATDVLKLLRKRVRLEEASRLPYNCLSSEERA